MLRECTRVSWFKGSASVTITAVPTEESIGPLPWTPPTRVRDLVRGCSAILWDFDGVLADTRKVQEDSYRHVLEAEGCDLPANALEGRFGLSEREIWESLSAELEIEVPVELLIRRRSDIYLPLARREVRPSYFVLPLLELAAGMKIPSLVVSAGSYPNLSALLSHWGLLGAFTQIYCTGSPAQAFLPTKRDRILHVISEHGLPGLLIEDSSEYLAFGRKYGLRTIGVSHVEGGDIRRDGCDYVLNL